MLKILFFLLGLTANMTTFVVNISIVELNLFSAILYVTVFCGIIIFKKIRYFKGSLSSTPLIYYMAICLSTLLSLLYMPDVWKGANINNLLTTIVGEISFLLLFDEKKMVYLCEYLIKGLKINCIIQSIWAVLQFILCVFAQTPLNYMLGLPNSYPKPLVSYQVCGLGYERAQLCVLLLLGICLFENKFVKFLFFTVIVLTESRCGILMISTYIITSIDYRHIHFHFDKKKIIGMLIALFSIIILFKQLFPYLLNSLQRFQNMEFEASGSRHISYYIRLWDLIKKVDLFNVIFGFGIYGSGYPYAKNYGTGTLLEPWIVESNWLMVFWGSGIVGFSCWITWFISYLKRFFRVNRKMFGFICSLFIGCIVYALMPNFIVIPFVVCSYYFYKDNKVSRE